MTLQEVAEFLHVSPTTVRRLTDSGKLACYRLSSRRSPRLFSSEQVVLFLASCEQGRPQAQRLAHVATSQKSAAP